jgi:glutathione S-transferase
MPHPVLFQFRFSHYNEKVRWALDFKRIPHRRRSLLPGFHIPKILWMTGQKSVPVLVLDGRTIADSTRIIAALETAFPEPMLYPSNDADRQRALALEEFFDEQLGAQLRRMWFYELLADPDFTARALAAGADPGQQRLFRLAFPVLRRVMAMDMKIDAAGADEGRTRTFAALDRIEMERQASGYLVGDRFSVADLTAAALLSPVVMPPEFSYPWLTPLPAGAAKFRESVASHPAFAWVSSIYRRHRGASMEVAT